MKTMMLAAAVTMMTAMAAPVFAADAPAKPATPAPAATTPAPAKPMPKMVHKAKMMPMKKGAPMIKPALEKSTDQLNQQQLDAIKK